MNASIRTFAFVNECSMSEGIAEYYYVNLKKHDTPNLLRPSMRKKWNCEQSIHEVHT